MDTPADRLRTARKRKGFRSAAAAAKAMGVQEPTYRAHESADNPRNFGADAAKQYARKFGVSWLWLLHGDAGAAQSNTVLVRGYVGADAQVTFFEPEAEIEETERPPGLSLDGVAVQVRGDSMRPVYGNGDLLYYGEVRKGAAISELVGLRCIVQISNGPALIKEISLGSSRAAFTLWSHNAAPRHDEKLAWAAFIEWHRATRRSAT